MKKRLARMCGIVAAAIGLASMLSPAYSKEEATAQFGKQFQEELSEQSAKLLSEYPVLKGSVVLSITLNKAGFISLVEAGDARLDDTAPLAGILEKVYKWKFSPLEIEEEQVTFDYTLAFSTEFDSTRIFFIVMGAIIVTITGLVVLVRIG